MNVTLDGRRHYVLALNPAPAAVPVARESLRAALVEWRQEHLVDDAELILSELVTNAIACATTITLLTYSSGRRVVVEVWDDSPQPPVRGDGTLDAECGRGLLIVESLAHRWGWRPVQTGKFVWAVVE